MSRSDVMPVKPALLQRAGQSSYFVPARSAVADPKVARLEIGEGEAGLQLVAADEVASPR